MHTDQQKASLRNCKTPDCEKLESVIVVGLHKQTTPKTSYRYVISVTWKNGCQTTIYRKMKEFKWFQNQLAVEISTHPEHDEASRFLSKQKKKTRTGIMTSSMGTAQRLKLIDAINMYLEVVTYYLYEVEQFRVLKYFISPSPLDLNAPEWSQNGKTFFCYNGSHDNNVVSTLPRDDVRSRDVSTKNVRTKEARMKRSISSSILFSPSVAVALPHERLSRQRSASMTSLPDDDSIYVADEDHVPREEDSSFNVIGLSAGEKVEVISKSKTGWWFVRRTSGSGNESCGYVPGSFLTPREEKKPDKTEEDRKSIGEDEPIYESMCYPLSHSPQCKSQCHSENHTHTEKQKSGEIISRHHDDDSNITPSLLRQENTGLSAVNLHKIKLQNLLANKV